VEQERATLARMKSVRTHAPDVVLHEGDRIVIRWLFEFERKDGVVLRMDELALQTWRGDRIQSERFYYDPGQMKS
jgi:ketosteroid isomerase-like protein